MQAADKDEASSWKAATVIMLFFSLLALTTALLGLNPFSLIFNFAIVGLPTMILVGSTLFERNRKSS